MSLRSWRRLGWHCLTGLPSARLVQRKACAWGQHREPVREQICLVTAEGVWPVGWEGQQLQKTKGWKCLRVKRRVIIEIISEVRAQS